MFNHFGKLERCAVRHGDVLGTDDWQEILDRVIARYAERSFLGYFCAGATLPNPANYQRLV